MELAHGSIHFEFDHRIFVIRLVGAINRETSQRAQIEHIKALEKCDLSSPWGVLVDMTDYLGHTPDAEDGSEEVRTWCLARNLSCEAYVYGDNAFKKSMIERFLSGLETQIPHQFFTTQADASDWLHRQLAR
ncbi:MAG: hypothetical protein ACPG4U_01555 [Pseudomonadales bacterium]